MFDSASQGLSTALHGILAADDESTRRCSEAVSRAQSAVVALSSAEAAAAAAMDFDLAQLLQAKKGEVGARLNRVTELMAPSKRSFDLQSLGKLLLHQREHSIVCLVFRSNNTALMRAMLLAAQPDLVLPPAADVRHSLMNQLLLAAFTRMQHDKESWVQAVVHAGFDASQLKAAGVAVQALKDAGFTAKQLQDAGEGPKSLVDLRYSASELKSVGITALQCFEMKYDDTAQLKELGFKATELKAAGYGLKSLVDARYNVVSLVVAGFTQEELSAAEIQCDVAGITRVLSAHVVSCECLHPTLGPPFLNPNPRTIITSQHCNCHAPPPPPLSAMAPSQRC